MKKLVESIVNKSGFTSYSESNVELTYYLDKRSFICYIAIIKTNIKSIIVKSPPTQVVNLFFYLIDKVTGTPNISMP